MWSLVLFMAASACKETLDQLQRNHSNSASSLSPSFGRQRPPVEVPVQGNAFDDGVCCSCCWSAGACVRALLCHGSVGGRCRRNSKQTMSCWNLRTLLRRVDTNVSCLEQHELAEITDAVLQVAVR